MFNDALNSPSIALTGHTYQQTWRRTGCAWRSHQFRRRTRPLRDFSQKLSELFQRKARSRMRARSMLQDTSDDQREYQPDYDEEERRGARGPRYQLARELARQLLKSLNITNPPVPVEDVVRHRGLTLIKADVDGLL